MTDPLNDPLHETKTKRGFFGALRTYFLTGLVVTGPVGLTFLLITWVIDLLDGWFKPLLPARFQPEQYIPYDIPGVGLIVALIIVLLVGGFTANFLGRRLIAIGDNIISQMPAIGTVYNALRQIFKAAIDNNRSFSEVAMIEYPRKGVWAIGFVTNDIEGQIADHVGGETIAIFLPTTPNPTSGFLLFLPKEDVKILDMTVEEGARLVISAGLTNEEKSNLMPADE
ncbi:MAG: DUF502 domain-containing protein [Parvibaculales bacterium]